MDEKITFGILKCLTHFGQKPQEIEGICQHVTGSYHLESSRINPKGKIKGYSEQIIILPGNVDKLIKKQMEKNNRPTDKKTILFSILELLVWNHIVLESLRSTPICYAVPGS